MAATNIPLSNDLMFKLKTEIKDPNDVRQTKLFEKSMNDWGKYTPADRSEWWKCQIKPYRDTGYYSKPTFIDILNSNPIKSSYGFLSDGRKRSVSKTRKGEYLLPGAYEYHDFGFLVQKKPSSYSFKVRPRRSKDNLRGFSDLNLNLAPGQYNSQDYLAINLEKGSDKMMAFKSKTKRFPSKEFEPRMGPAPGEYDVVCSNPLVPITSSFKSASARFKPSHNKVPGPGTYDKSYQSPPPAELKHLGRQHGLFFNSTFCN